MGTSSEFPSNEPPSNAVGKTPSIPADTAIPVGARVSVIPDELNQALLEFDLMLRYILSEGIELDDQTRKAVIAVQQLLLESRQATVPSSQPAGAVASASSEPTVAVPPEPSFPLSPQAPVVAPTEPAFAEQLLTAHGALAKLIAPATPLSLAATEPGRRFGYLSNPPLIRWMIFIALASVIGFLVTSIILGGAKP